MKPYTRYTESFKEQALAKVYNRNNDQTIPSIADDLNISLQTLKKWIKKTELTNTLKPSSKSKRAKDWSPQERLAALHKTYELQGEDLNAWCRERGIFVHQLEQWTSEFCSQSDLSGKRDDAVAMHTLKAEIHSLERELLRKDRALAEAAALLVLQKKFRALLGGEVE
jgi:transposase-like protein